MTGTGKASQSGPASSDPDAGGGGGWGQTLRNSRQYALLKSAVRLLQDNRAATDNGGDSETAERLKEINRSQNDSCPLVKSVLNCMFVTVGVVLLLGVVVVIIYTSIVKPGSDGDIFRNMMKTYVDEHHQTTDDDNEPDPARHRNPISDNTPESDFDDWSVDSGPISAEVADASSSPISSGRRPPEDHPASRITMNDDDSFTGGHNELPEWSSKDDERGDRRKTQAPVVISMPVTKRPNFELNGESHGRHSLKKAVRCRYVPFVKPDQTVVQLVQICNEVPQAGSGSSSSS